jgi:hypothetical protein
MFANCYKYVSNMTDKPGIRPAGSNDSNHWLENFRFHEGVSPTSSRQYRTFYLAFQKIQQTLSVESLNPPDTQTRAAHLSLACLAQESRTLR